jgi:hypothetical protein
MDAAVVRLRSTPMNNRAMVPFWYLYIQRGKEKPAKLLKKWCPGAESNHRHHDFHPSGVNSGSYRNGQYARKINGLT